MISRREAIQRAALLAGVALSPELFTFVGRAQTAAAKTYLSAAQGAIARAAVDRILPRTDTPGAVDVGVPAFIDLFYGEFMSPAEQKLLIKSLDDVEAGRQVGARRLVRHAHRGAAGWRTAKRRHRAAGDHREFLRRAALGHDPRLLHVRAGRQERAALRPRPWRLRRVCAYRSGRPAQLDDVAASCPQTGPAAQIACPALAGLRLG